MLTFKRNMKGIDRLIRIIVGCTLITIGPITNTLELQTLLTTILGTIGVFAILSGIFAYCVLYEVAGYNVDKKN